MIRVPLPGMPPEPPRPMSRWFKLVAKQERLLAAGEHPASHFPLKVGVEEATCGSCYYRDRNWETVRPTWTCAKARLHLGINPRLKLRWPGCTLWRRREED